MLRTIAVAAALLANIACVKGGETYTVGAAGPWKEGYGVMTRRGIDLAVQEVNRSGGVRGGNFAVVARDDGADAARATAIAQEFVANPEILAVIGHVNSGAMMSASRIYDGRLTAMATTASSPDLSGISRWTYRVISSDSLNGVILARFASRIGGDADAMKRVSILYENDAYGRGLADAFRRAFRGTIVSFDPISETVNPEPFVSYMKMKQPGIVFIAGREESALRILRESRRQGFEPVFIGGDGWQSVVTDPAASEGAYVGTSFNSENPDPDVQRFVSAFQARYQVKPDAFAALAYDATRLVAQALNKSGRDRQKVRDYYQSLTRASPFQGVTGPIYFNDSGDPIGMGFHVAQVVSGVLVSGGARVAVNDAATAPGQGR